jgi:hypothetical protein
MKLAISNAAAFSQAGHRQVLTGQVSIGQVLMVFACVICPGEYEAEPNVR